MKIALVSSAYHPYYRGGGEYSVKALAEGLVRQRHTVRVITAHERASTEEIEGVRVYRVRHPNIYWSYRSAHRAGWQKFVWHAIESYNLRVAARVRPILEREKPDVLHIRNIEDFSPYLGRVALALGIPVVVTLNSYTWLCPKASMFKHGRNCSQQCRDCRWITLPKKYLSRHVDVVVGVSRFMVDTHQTYGYFPRARAEVIYTSATARPLPLPVHHNGYVCFGYIGRIHPMKGVHEIIRAFRSLKGQHRLYIAGDGPADYEQQCRAEASNSENIIFLGKTDALEFYRQVDTVIVSSLWNEPFPRVLIEAYAHGRPVIAATTGGTTEMVKDQHTGFLFDPRVPTQLVERMQEVAGMDVETMERMQQQVVNFLEHNLPDEIQRYISVYQSL